jgi:hypothetical protein
MTEQICTLSREQNDTNICTRVGSFDISSLLIESYQWHALLYNLFLTSSLQDACVLCKIFQKSGPGPKIGAQYGAPFNEEDWNDASNVECSPGAPSVAHCVPESSHGVLNSAGQHLAVSYDGKVSLGSSAESINRPAVNGVHPDRPSPDIPNDCIHIQLLAEIIRCSSMHPLCTGGEDGLLVISLTPSSFLFFFLVSSSNFFISGFNAA